MSHTIWLVFPDNTFISLQMQAKRSPLALGDSVLWRACLRSGIKPHPFVHVTSDHIIHAWEPWHMWVQSDWLDDPCSRQTAFKTTFMQAEIKNNENETIVGRNLKHVIWHFPLPRTKHPNPVSSYLSGGTKDIIWCYWPSTSPRLHPYLPCFNISLISTPASAQFHPCVRTQTARSRGWSSSRSSQPRFRQAVAWGAGQDGWQGVLPPPSHCFIQFLRNLGLLVVRNKIRIIPFTNKNI